MSDHYHLYVAVSWGQKVSHHNIRQDNQCYKSVMMIIFFNVSGIICSEFSPQDRTISQKICRSILQYLLWSVHEKRQVLWQEKLWQVHHIYASAHNTLSIWQFIALQIAIQEQSCSVWVLFFFPLKFKWIINRAITTEQRGIASESLQQCIDAWQRRTEKSIRLERDYFEGETIVCCSKL